MNSIPKLQAYKTIKSLSNKIYPLKQTISLKEIKTIKLEDNKKFSIRKNSIPLSEKEEIKNITNNLNVKFNYDEMNQLNPIENRMNKLNHTILDKESLLFNHKNSILNYDSNDIITQDTKNSLTCDQSISKKKLAKKEASPSVFKSIINKQNSIIDLSCIDEEYYDELNSPFNEKEESSSKCMICNWVYPNEMSSEEINAHLNYCLEGRGEEHRMDYMKSLKIINLTLSKEDKSSCNLSQEIIESCPICGKKFKTKGKKIRDNHMIDCLREKEENESLKDRKRKTSSRMSYFIDK